MTGPGPRIATTSGLVSIVCLVISLIEGTLGPSPRTARTPGLVYIGF